MNLVLEMIQCKGTLFTYKITMLKQLLCPLKPTLYLIWGLEFWHRWRTIKGADFVYCNKCGKIIKADCYYTEKHDPAIIREDTKRFKLPPLPNK